MRRLARSAVRLALAALVVGASGVAAPRTGLANPPMYEYENKDGEIVFTNVRPPRGAKLIRQSGPGKAQTVGGTSIAGCRASRADVVPARDRSPDRYARYDEIISEASDLYAIPEALIRAVIKVESDYDPKVVSCAGAKGLMQIMPYEEKSQRIEDVFAPRDNILAGTRLLRISANRFQGDLTRTIAAYHAGVGAVDKYGGVPPYQTTRDYVRMVTTQYERFRARELGAVGGAGASRVARN